MLPDALEKLLILQDRDLKRLSLEAQLRNLPLEVATVERAIAAEKAAIEAARTEVRELESRKKLLETEIGSAEQKLGTYRTQQLAVRKNDEYQALGHQIETTQGQIGDLEGQELMLMYEIDEAKKRFAAAESILKQNISGYESRVRACKEREASVTEELKTAKTEVERARAEVAVPMIRAYDRLTNKMPAVVPLRGSKCGGCHLKVSSEVESAARALSRGGTDIPACDQCGRIVYWESE